MDRVRTERYEWGVASRALDGVSGDGHRLIASPDAVTLAVVDGLGHGRAAGEASQRALDLLGDIESLERAVAQCHAGLRSSRGVVLAVARLDDSRDELTWLSVGNIQGVMLRRRRDGEGDRRLIGHHGVLGRSLPPLMPRVERFSPGDLFLVATDGIEPGFDDSVPWRESAQAIAEHILARYGSGDDDALVVAVRHRGSPA